MIEFNDSNADYSQGGISVFTSPVNADEDIFIMAMVDESCWNDDLKTLNTHVRQIATYVASNQRAEC